MKMMDLVPTLYTKEKAEEVAKTMNETDDFIYTPIHDPKGTGYSMVEVKDENGGFIAYM